MSDKKVPNNVIQFPTTRTRVGKKYRQEEIQRIRDLLQLCDEDMATIVEQIEQLNVELNILTREYEVLMERLKKLLKVEGDKK